MRAGILLLIVAAGCVRYTKQTVEWDGVAKEIAARSPGDVDFEGALAFARRHNPELRRLRAEAEAAGLDVPAYAITLSANTLEAKASAFVDPLAMLEIGPRGTRADAAGARERALLAKWRDRDLDVAAGIAEAFLVERVLARRDLPEIAIDPELFARAGLASEVDQERVRYAVAQRKAEEATIEALRAENRAHLRLLLGVGPDAPLTLLVPDGAFPPLPEDGDLLRRPDLHAALARYRVADLEFRAAVQDQYPVLGIGPAFNWDMVGWGLLVPVRIPIGAAAPARAAGRRREAARLAVEEALLAAEEDAAKSRHRLVRADAEADAARIGAQASTADLHSALVRVEVTPDAFRHVSAAAPNAIERLAHARAAELEAARARVALARAYAWPHGPEPGAESAEEGEVR